MILQDAKDKIAIQDGNISGWTVFYEAELNFTSYKLLIEKAAELYASELKTELSEKNKRYEDLSGALRFKQGESESLKSQNSELLDKVRRMDEENERLTAENKSLQKWHDDKNKEADSERVSLAVAETEQEFKDRITELECDLVKAKEALKSIRCLVHNADPRSWQIDEILKVGEAEQPTDKQEYGKGFKE